MNFQRDEAQRRQGVERKDKSYVERKIKGSDIQL